MDRSHLIDRLSACHRVRQPKNALPIVSFDGRSASSDHIEANQTTTTTSSNAIEPARQQRQHKTLKMLAGLVIFLACALGPITASTTAAEPIPKPLVPWLGPLKDARSWPPKIDLADINDDVDDLFEAFSIYRKDKGKEANLVTLLPLLEHTNGRIMSNVSLIFTCWSNMAVQLVSERRNFPVCSGVDRWHSQAVLMDKADFNSALRQVQFATFHTQGLLALKEFQLRYLIENNALNIEGRDQYDEQDQQDYDYYYHDQQRVNEPVVDIEGISPAMLKRATRWAGPRNNTSGLFLKTWQLSDGGYFGYLPKDADLMLQVTHTEDIGKLSFQVEAASVGSTPEVVMVTKIEGLECQTNSNSILPVADCSLNSKRVIEFVWKLPADMFGLVISNIKANGKTPKQINLRTSTPDDTGDNQIFVAPRTYSPLATLFARREENLNPDSEDKCYQVIKMKSSGKISSSEIIVALYLSMPDSEEGVQIVHLSPHQRSTDVICVADVFALKLDTYVVTLLVRGVVARDDYSLLLRTTSRPMPSIEIAPPEEPKLFNRWLYYSALHDYTITSKNKLVSGTFDGAFKACDFTGHCFGYHQLGEQSFGLFQSHLDILKASPYVRINTNLAEHQQADFVLGYGRANERTQKDLDEVKKTNIVSNDWKEFIRTDLGNEDYKSQLRIEIDGQGAMKVTIKNQSQKLSIRLPLKMIDLRFQSMRLELDQLSVAHFKLRKVLLTGTSKEEEASDEWTTAMPLDLPLYGRETLNTDAFVSVLAYKKQPYEKSVLEFEVSVDPILTAAAQAEISFTMNIKVEALSKHSVPDHVGLGDIRTTWFGPTAVQSGRAILIPATAFLSNSIVDDDGPVMLMKNKNVGQIMLITPWLESVRRPIGSTISMSFDTANEPKSIERYLISANGFHSSPLKTFKVESEGDILWRFDDNFERVPVLRGRYRVAYVASFFGEMRQIKFHQVNISTVRDGPECRKLGPTYRQVDCTLEGATCPWALYRPVGSDRCLQTTIYYNIDRRCNLTEGCRNLFDQQLETSVIYRDESTSTTYLPYQVNTVGSYLVYPRPENLIGGEKKDWCLSFNYKALQEPLIITATGSLDHNPIVPFHIKYTYTASYLSPKAAATVCASWLHPYLDLVEFITFQYLNVTHRANIIGQHLVSDIVFDGTPAKTQPILDGIFLNNLAAEQFVFLSDHWTLDDDNASISFRLDMNATWLDAWNWQGGHRHYRSSVRTRWIRMTPEMKGKMQLLMRYDLTGASRALSYRGLIYYELTIHSWNQGVVEHRNLTKLSADKVNIISLDAKNSEFFQFELSFNTFFDQLPLDVVRNESFQLTLSNFSINDPCRSETGHEQTCSGQGRCRRVSGSAFYCECHPGSTGVLCDKINFCERPNNQRRDWFNQRYCHEMGFGKCLNDDKLQTYNCECPVSPQRWDITSERCIDPVATKCPGSQVPALFWFPGTSNQSVQCECPAGHIRVAPLPLVICEPIDVCNAKHREKMNWKQIKCPTFQHCVPKKEASGRELDSGAYDCVCDQGYDKVAGTCRHRACDIEQRCAQTCHPRANETFECSCNANYEANGEQCHLRHGFDDSRCFAKSMANNASTVLPFLNEHGGGCSCRAGYLYNAATNECDLNLAYYRSTNPFGCADQVKKGINGRAECLCKPNQILDQRTRFCRRQQCTHEEQTRCKRIDGFCELDGQTGAPICQCHQNKVKYIPKGKKFDEDKRYNTSEQHPWKCRDKCDLAKLLVGECDIFEECHADKVKMNNLRGVEQCFVEGESEIQSNRHEHCHCQYGFEETTPSGGSQDVPRCLPISKPTQSISMHFKSDSHVNWKPYFARLLRWLLSFDAGESPYIVGDIECTPKEGKRVECSTGFRSEMSKDRLLKLLQRGCFPFDNHKELGVCGYFLLADAIGTAAANLLAIQGEGPFPESGHFPQPEVLATLERGSNWPIKIERINYCPDAKSRLSRCNSPNYANSLCTPQGDTTLFDCLCDRNHFETITSRTFRLRRGDKQIRLESCSPKNFCSMPAYRCVDPNANCSQVIKLDQEGVYKAETFCLCSSPTNFTLAHHNQTCRDTCDGYCQHGSCVIERTRGQKVCNCQEGYYGPQCNQFDDSDEAVKGFRVATIVLGICTGVFLIIIVGIIIHRFTNRY